MAGQLFPVASEDAHAQAGRCPRSDWHVPDGFGVSHCGCGLWEVRASLDTCIGCGGRTEGQAQTCSWQCAQLVAVSS